MFLRFFCKFLILLFISGIFSAKRLTCEQVYDSINVKIDSKKYNSALILAKGNKKNKDCTAEHYFNLGNVFLIFDDFNNTRELYNKALSVASDTKQYNSIKLEFDKLRFLLAEINFIKQSFDNDQDKEKAISNYKGLISGNNKWDQDEPYIDQNLNNSYDEKNGVWDEGEKFTDANNNNLWDDAEEFIDCNIDQSICADDWKKELYKDNALDLIDCTVGDNPDSVKLTIQECMLANEDENYLKNKFKIESNLWNEGMGNGVWDKGEKFTDKDGNGSWGSAEPFIDEYEKFTDWSFPKNGYLYLLIAEIYKKSQDYSNATLYLKEALKINPFVKSYKDQMSIISKMIAKEGNDFLRLNKFDEAIEKYKLSLSIDTTESSIHYNLANAYFQKDDFLKSIDSYKEVEKLDSEKYKALHKMGVCYQKLDNHELAVFEFEKAIEVIEDLNENFMSSYNELALSHMELNQYSEAKKYLNIIINKSPRYYKAYETLGVLCMEATDAQYRSNECALENFLEATKIKPSSYILKFRLAQLYNIIAEEYKENQNYRNMNANLLEAKKNARQCRQLKKTYGGAYFELGVSELNLCNKSSGIKALKQAAKYDRRYRSEVKRIIKKIEPFMNHCE